MYKVTVVWEDGCSIKNNPNTGGSPIGNGYIKGDVFFADELVPDNTDQNNPTKKWARLSATETHAGKYVAVLYPSSSRGNVRCTWVEVEVPNPDPNPIFPDSYIMYDPANPNVKAEYKFVRILPE